MQPTTATMTTPECPECTATITTHPTMVGEILTCDGCQVELEVRSLQPLAFTVAPEIQEDWGE